MQTLRHVVVGTDFSECSELALAMAIVVAEDARARLTLVHVCVDDVDDERLIHGRLSALLSRQRARHVETASVLRFGRPAEKLENVATEVGAGLLVVGRQGAFLGAVASLLVRIACRPVLIVPGPSHAVTKGTSP